MPRTLHHPTRPGKYALLALLAFAAGSSACSKEAAPATLGKTAVALSATSKPAAQPGEYMVELGGLSARLPLAGLQGAEVSSGAYPRLWVNYDEYGISMVAPETHTTREHLVRDQVSGLPPELMCSEAETRRAVYTLKDRQIPGHNTRLSWWTARNLKKLQQFITPGGIIQCDTASGHGFTAVVTVFARAADIQGWSSDEMTVFVILIGLPKHSKADLNEIVKPVFAGLYLNDANGPEQNPPTLADFEKIASELNQAATGLRSATQPDDN